MDVFARSCGRLLRLGEMIQRLLLLCNFTLDLIMSYACQLGPQVCCLCCVI